MTALDETKRTRTLWGLRRTDFLVASGIAVPALAWAFLNFGMTLVFGHPTTDTRELPYVEVALQGLLALGVLIILPKRSRWWWLVILVPLPVWTLIRAVTTGTSPIWAALLSVLLLSPILSALLACQQTERITQVLRIAFIVIMASQLLTFPFNFVGWLAEDTALPLDRFPVDRFSGTLIGRGGYFSSYILLAGAFFLATTRVRPWFKIMAFTVVLAYAWVAEVKLIFFVTGIVLATVLLFTCTRRTAAVMVPGAIVAASAGLWLSLTVPSSYGLTWANYRFTLYAPQQSVEQLEKLTQTRPDPSPTASPNDESNGSAPTETNGSKMATTIAVMSPTSSLWGQVSDNALMGVGPSGGLSHLARIADASGSLTDQIRPQPDFRDEARSLAGSRQRDQSLVTQPESTVNGVVSEIGYVGLLLFLTSFVLAVRLSLRVITRAAVGVFVGFAVAFVPLFSLWETPGFWMVVALGMASVGMKSTLSHLPRSATN